MIQRHKTALNRSKLSRPVSLLLERGLLTENSSFFDYGCGHGSDIKILKKNNFKEVYKFDPFYFPENEKTFSQIVNLGFVLNVIEDRNERKATLLEAFKYASRLLCVSVMIRKPSSIDQLNKYQDGEISTRNTFQKYFEQSEIKSYLEKALERDAIPLEPGIFIVFKKDSDKYEFLLNNSSRRRTLEVTQLNSSTGRPEKKRVLKKDFNEFIEKSPYFEKLMRTTENLGRFPLTQESNALRELSLEFKDKKKIKDQVFQNLDIVQFMSSRSAAIEETLLFLSLRRFDRLGFPKKKNLPIQLVADIDDFFPNYKLALNQSLQLLYSMGNESVLKQCFKDAQVGKHLPQALYIHSDYIHTLPTILRLKVGIAKSYAGDIPGTSILKINKIKNKVSFLVYQNFDKFPHPALIESYVIDLKKLYINYWDFSKRENPPILHRKETFVGEDYPRYNLFKKLTLKEESLNLLSTPDIGTKEKWEKLLANKGLKIQGHDLKKIK